MSLGDLLSAPKDNISSVSMLSMIDMQRLQDNK